MDCFFPVAKVIRRGSCAKFIPVHYGTKPSACLFGRFFVPLHIHDTVYIEHAVEIKDTTVHILTDEHRRYELALRYCIGTAKRQCDSVRARRSQMDILAYKNYVDSAYFAIAFDYMDKVIKRRMQEDFPGDSLLIMRYGNEIFAQCREVCVELMREIPIDELTSAARSEQNAQQ